MIKKSKAATRELYVTQHRALLSSRHWDSPRGLMAKSTSVPSPVVRRRDQKVLLALNGTSVNACSVQTDGKEERKRISSEITKSGCKVHV